MGAAAAPPTLQADGANTRICEAAFPCLRLHQRQKGHQPRHLILRPELLDLPTLLRENNEPLSNVKSAWD